MTRTPGSTAPAPARAGNAALLGLLLLTLAGAGTLLHTHATAPERTAAAAATRALVARLGLTDLALFTEARYTRHPSLADRHSAFQDHPLALDHFPSGALLGPPAHLRQ